MRINPKIESILNKALAREEICREEAVELMKIDENSHEMYALLRNWLKFVRCARQYLNLNSGCYEHALCLVLIKASTN